MTSIIISKSIINLLGHGVHHARRLLRFLDIVGKVEARAAIGADENRSWVWLTEFPAYHHGKTRPGMEGALK